jgi:succinate dehydrogenase / fumarate reductase cytochrome b subunit
MSEKNQNKQVNRPLSPHISIYKPQITSILSITHRITGIGLFIGALLLAWWIVLNVYGCGDCINDLIGSVVGKTFLFLWTLALYYHLFNGIRHLFWDVGSGLQIKSVNSSGILVLVATVIFTFASWFALFI